MFCRTLFSINKEIFTQTQIQTTNFGNLIKAMTPVRFEDGSSTEEDESDTDPSVMDLLSCFKEVSCNGLKVRFEKHKVDFLPSLSAISLVNKKVSNLDEFSSGNSNPITPMKKQNFSNDSTTGTGVK
jgi:hypothetical protein